MRKNGPLGVVFISWTQVRKVLSGGIEVVEKPIDSLMKSNKNTVKSKAPFIAMTPPRDCNPGQDE
jgi:hypothetical protein